MVMTEYGKIAYVPEIKSRLFFTMVALAIYRVGCVVPTPGINADALSVFFLRYKSTMLGLVDMFSGGALERMSIFALGIMPYISASIILELMTVIIPYLSQLKKEGQVGRRKITQYARYGTVIFSLIQGIGIAIGLETMTTSDCTMVVSYPGWGFRLITMVTLTAGTAFIMWLGERITEHGIGNGISLIIFAGIIARIPSATIDTIKMVTLGEFSVFLLLVILILMITVVSCIVFVEQGQRRLSVQYARRVVGRRMYGGQITHLPLKINTSGVIPPIFASSIIMLPATIAQFIQVKWVQDIAKIMTPGGWVYSLIYVIFIFFFAYFYTAITFNPIDVAENMKRNGGFIPGIRPGKRTADYIDRVLTRITMGGAAYLAAICVLPTILTSEFNVPFYFGGTALLIVVGVAMETMVQLESHLLQRKYEGFFKRGVGKGRITM